MRCLRHHTAACQLKPGQALAMQQLHMAALRNHLPAGKPSGQVDNACTVAVPHDREVRVAGAIVWGRVPRHEAALDAVAVRRDGLLNGISEEVQLPEGDWQADCACWCLMPGAERPAAAG